MTADRQINVPASFVAIYTPEGRARPTPPRQWLEERHDLCEDLAQLLTDKAKDKVWQLGITQDDAVERIELGLPQLALDLSPPECQWVMTRVREILQWG